MHAKIMKLINEEKIAHCEGLLYSRILHKRIVSKKNARKYIMYNSETDVRKIIKENCILFMRK